jgi:hypothetical protein
MTETLHPADEVPGERGKLWGGAQLRWKDAVWSVLPCGLLMARRLLHVVEVEPVAGHLILPGPLGLGLAGLAARVAERVPGLPAAPKYLASVLRQASWYHGPHHADDWSVIAWAASHLALTDRLCAAVGLERRPGEVAGWTEEGGIWELRTRAGGYGTVEVDEHSPLEALRAELRCAAGGGAVT